MPEGPLGFPRSSTLGPLTRETEEELREQWESCEANARDDVDIAICRSIKETAVELISDQSIRPKVQNLEDINAGFCRLTSETTLEDVQDNRKIRMLLDGTMGFHHCWIMYRGRHFDAEVPTGVEDLEDMPAWQREGFIPTPETWRDVTGGI